MSRTGRTPKRLLVDTTYATTKDIAAFAALPEPITVYAPPMPDRPGSSPQSVRKRAVLRSREPEAVKAWRVRMDSDEGRTVFARRKRIERVNSDLKRRGLGHMLVRGMAKVQSVCILHALAHNLMAADRLREA